MDEGQRGQEGPFARLAFDEYFPFHLRRSEHNPDFRSSIGLSEERNCVERHSKRPRIHLVDFDDVLISKETTHLDAADDRRGWIRWSGGGSATRTAAAVRDGDETEQGSEGCKWCHGIAVACVGLVDLWRVIKFVLPEPE